MAAKGLTHSDPHIHPLMPPTENALRATLAWVCTLLIAGTDFVTSDINLSILYSLSVLLLGSTRELNLKRFATVASLFALAGYLLGPRPPGLETLSSLLTNYRMINRSFAVLSIILVTYALRRWHRFKAESLSYPPDVSGRDPNQMAYAELIVAFQQWTALLICAVLIIAIAVADIVSPRSVNYPILYAAPLLVCLWARVRRMIWGVLPILLVFNLVGYLVSQPGSPTANPSAFLYNRAFAAITTVAIAVALDAWVARGKQPMLSGH